MVKEKNNFTKDEKLKINRLISYIMGNNPKSMVYYNPANISQLINAINYHYNHNNDFLSWTIEQQMDKLFGKVWKNWNLDDENNIDNNIDNNLVDNINNDKQLNNNYEQVNHPKHYNLYPIEAIEMARRIWGDEAMKTTAEITAFFYRMRMGLKPENSVQQELNKEKFWLDVAKNIDDKIKSNNSNIS